MFAVLSTESPDFRHGEYVKKRYKMKLKFILIIFLITIVQGYCISPKSIFYEKKYNIGNIYKIQELSGGNSKEKPLLLFTSTGKYILKPMSHNLKDTKYFAKLVEYLYLKQIKINKLIKTKNNEYYIEIDNIYYMMFEYFENFETKLYQQNDFYKIGEIAAQIFNCTCDLFIIDKKCYLDRAEILQRLIKKYSKFQNILQDMIDKFNSIKNYFLKSHIHNDLNYRNVDISGRIIDIGLAQYDYRINEFMNIIFGNPDLKRFLDISVFDILNCILGYNSKVIIPLNIFELKGIILILKSKMYEDLLSNRKMFEPLKFELLEKFYFSA
jgi:hypothetical protein